MKCFHVAALICALVAASVGQQTTVCRAVGRSIVCNGPGNAYTVCNMVGNAFTCNSYDNGGQPIGAPNRAAREQLGASIGQAMGQISTNLILQKRVKAYCKQHPGEQVYLNGQLLGTFASK